MTTQVRDEVHFQGEIWALWGSQGQGLFDPTTFGIGPVGAASTACWRGYCSTYHFENEQLKLLQLEINQDEEKALLLNGRRAVKNDPAADSICGELTYLDVQLPVPFSGGLLLGRQWTTTFSPTIAHEEIWRFEKVFELILDGGKLVHAFDRSASVAKVRSEKGALARREEFASLIGLTGEELRVKCDVLFIMAKERYEIIENELLGCFQQKYP